MGTGERRKREKERKAQEIIEAAKQLFFSKGLEATSMDDVAAQAEVSKGALYLHFANKDELYFAVAKDGMRILHGLFQEAAGKFERGIDRLEAIGDAYVRFWMDHPDYRRLMHEMKMNRPSMASGPRGREFAAIANQCNEIMVQAAEDGVSDGSIRPDISPELFVFCAASMVEGILSRTELRDRNPQSDLWREQSLAYASRMWRDAVTVER